MSEETKANAPAYKNERGRMKLAVFANERGGKIRYSIKITRNYKTDDGFQTTSSYDDYDDVYHRFLAADAACWIDEQRREAYRAENSADAEPETVTEAVA